MSNPHHVSLFEMNGPIDPKYLDIEFYTGNLGIVLQYKITNRPHIIAYLDGKEFGFNAQTPVETVKALAKPIFDIIVETYNHTYGKAYSTGWAAKRLQLKDAIDQ